MINDGNDKTSSMESSSDKESPSGKGKSSSNKESCSDKGKLSVEAKDATDSEAELYDDESSEELYDPGYDPKEYEEELLDFSYESEDPSKYVPENEARCNEDGKEVGDVPVVVDESFIVHSEDYNVTGTWRIDWESNAKNADPEGFDKSCPVTVETLAPDTVIVRYGSERGRYGTDKGTDHSNLSLPYDPKSQEYHEYKVIKPTSCRKGTIAQNFGQEGKGVQYVFKDTFAEMSDTKNPNRTLEKIR